MINFFLKKNLWLFLIIIVLLMSVPSIFRIWNIRYLYFSKNIQNLAVESNLALRNTYGIGATDAKLKKIEKIGNHTVFYFNYKYNHPAEESVKSEKYLVEFVDSNLKNVSKNKQ